MNKVLLLIIFLLLVLGIAVAYETTKTEMAMRKAEIPTALKPNVQTAPQPVKMSVMDKVMNSDSTKTGTLEDVVGGTSSGKAYILRDNGMLYHYVSANLPEPEGTNQYEGWLVKREPELTLFSTGLLKMQEDGTYSLSYTRDDIAPGHDFVVITEETVIGDTAEEHILEGEVIIL